MIAGSCHCGAVRWELANPPAFLTECNCSICRRLGTLWAHAPASEITLYRDGDATLGYVWGDRLLAFHTCRSCGCTTHWESLSTEENPPMAVNFRMADPAELENLRIRRFDGADSWRYLD